MKIQFFLLLAFVCASTAWDVQFEIPSCAADISKFRCPSSDVIKCLKDNRQHLEGLCAEYLASVESCYADVKAVCGGDKPSFWCLANHMADVSSSCFNSDFLADVLQVVGSLRSRISTTISKVEGTVKALHPCLKDLEVLKCDGMHPADAFHCLKLQAEQMSGECSTYMQSMETCVAEAKPLCANAKCMVNCLWENRDRLSKVCKVSSYYNHLEKQAAALLKSVGHITIPDCAEDVVQHSCDSRSFTTCLKSKQEMLTASCGSYLSDMEKCYEDVKDKCGGQTVPFMCIADNMDHLSERCTQSLFFNDVLKAAGDLYMDIKDTTKTIQEHVKQAHPCLKDFEATQCLLPQPQEAFNCLRDQGAKVATECQAYMQGIEQCVHEATTICDGAPRMMNCLWEHKAQLTSKCKASRFWKHAESSFDSVLDRLGDVALPECLSDIVVLDCVAPDFKTSYECLKSQTQRTCPECHAAITGIEGCVTRVSDECPLDENIVQCLWDKRDKLADTCKLSTFFQDMKRQLGRVVHDKLQVPEVSLACFKDMVHLKCNKESFHETVDCLVQSHKQLSSECAQHMDGAKECFHGVVSFCPEGRLSCLWAHRNSLPEACTGSQFYTGVQEIMDGIKQQHGAVVTRGAELVKKGAEVLSCAKEFVNLGCHASTDIMQGLNCMWNSLDSITPQCRSYFGGADVCLQEYQDQYCAAPEGRLKWLFDHRDKVSEACKEMPIMQNIGISSIRSLGTCLRDSLRQRCLSMDPISGMQCLLDKKDHISGSCRSLFDGVDMCMDSVTQGCGEELQLSQLLWIYTNRGDFSEKCKVSPFFGNVDKALKMITSGLRQADLLSCSTDISKFKCVQHRNNPQMIVQCLKDAMNDPLSTVSDMCTGALMEVHECYDSVNDKCGDASDTLSCLWEHRDHISEACKKNRFWKKIQNTFATPLSRVSELGHILKDIADGDLSLSWPCAIDQKLQQCRADDTPEEQIRCLLSHAANLTASCQEFFVGREQCVNEVKDKCPELDFSDGENTLQEGICVWKHRQEVSQNCLQSLFFQYFLFPRQTEKDSNLLIDPGTSDKPDGNTGTDGPTTDPKPSPEPVPKDVPKDAVPSPDASDCQHDAAVLCADVLGNDPHSGEVRKCLSDNKVHLTPMCAKWHAGREVCFDDVKDICGPKANAFKCMVVPNDKLSYNCKNSLFYHGVLAWAKTYDEIDMGAAKTEEEYPVLQQTLLILVIGSAVVLLLGLILAGVFYTRIQKARQGNGDLKMTGVVGVADPSGSRTPLAEKTPPTLIEDVEVRVDVDTPALGVAVGQQPKSL
jgi:hypothetical protein